MLRTLWVVRRVAITLGLASMLGCGALDDFEEVIVDETVIGASSRTMSPFSPAFMGGAFDGLELSNAKNFQNNGVSPDDVDAIFVKSVRLEVESGSNNPAIDRLDLYLSSATLWIEAPGLERRPIGTATSFPMAASTELTVDPAFNLKPYAVAPSMNVGADIVLKQAPAINITLRTTVTLLVDINLLGT